MNFIDKALKALEAALGISSTSSSICSSTKIDEDNDRSDGDNDDAVMEIASTGDCTTGMKAEFHLPQEAHAGVTADGGEMNSSSNVDSFSCAADDITIVGKCCNPLSSFSSLSSLDMTSRQLEGHHTYTAASSEQILYASLNSRGICSSDDENQIGREVSENFWEESSHRVTAEDCDSLIAKRLRYVKGYLKLRHTTMPEAAEMDLSSVVSEWLKVCSGEVVHVTPLPAYRNAKDLTAISSSPLDFLDCTYECRGVNAVAMDSVRIAHYFDTLEVGACCTVQATDEDSGEEQGESRKDCEIDMQRSDLACSRSRNRLWRAVYNMDSDSAHLCGDGNSLSVSYVLTVELSDKSVYVAVPPKITSALVPSEKFGAESIKCPVTGRLESSSANSCVSGSADCLCQTHQSTQRIMECENSNVILVLSDVESETNLDKIETIMCDSSSGTRDSEREKDGDDDIVRWIAMALDTTSIRHSRQKRHIEENCRRKIREQERYGTTQWDGTESESEDSETCITFRTRDTRKRKRKWTSRSGGIALNGGEDCSRCGCSSNNSCSTTEIDGREEGLCGEEERKDSGRERERDERENASLSAGVILLRLRVAATVEFGGTGSDSDGRILRISENFAVHEDNISHPSSPLAAAVDSTGRRFLTCAVTKANGIYGSDSEDIGGDRITPTNIRNSDNAASRC